MAGDFETIMVEQFATGVRRITLDRPEVRNAQNKAMTYELNRAFDEAAGDRDAKVIVLAGAGPHFNAGHDTRDRTPIGEFDTVSTWREFHAPGVEGWMAAEHELYLQMCLRWRNFPKPTVAQVHGRTIAGGLMLMWVCDLIVAADDATFSDPTVAYGVNGVEYFAHPWELGPRKAKELLFTGDELTAHDAVSLGMVNRVVPLADLEAVTMAMAEKIATKPSMGLKLAKQSVNQAVDAQGFRTALDAAMSLQQLGHSNNQQVHGMPIDPAGLPPSMRPQPQPERRDGD
ncbi:enoyl-CoA hydratase [soil metagenome]